MACIGGQVEILPIFRFFVKEIEEVTLLGDKKMIKYKVVDQKLLEERSWRSVCYGMFFCNMKI